MPTFTRSSEFPFHGVAEQPEYGSPSLAAIPTRDFVVFFLIVAGLVLAANVFTLSTIPPIHTDEAWYANLAQNWITTGNRWTTLDVGPFPDGRGQGTTLLGAVPTRVAIQLWGLSLQAIRMPSLLAGLALLIVVAGIGSLLWPGRSGLLAALVLAIQPLFLLSSHMARPEIWLTLVVLLALGCSVLGWKRNQPLWDAAAGLLAVLSVDIHQNGVVFACALAATYVARYGRTVLRRKSSLVFCATSLLGALVYLYRNPEWVLPIQGSGNGGGMGVHASHSIPLLSSNPMYWLLKEVARYLFYFGNYPLDALLLGLAIAAALRRRGTADRLLLAWLAGSAVALMLLVNSRLELYLLPMISVGFLLVGRGMADLLQHPESWGRQTMVLTLGVLMLPLMLWVGGSITVDPAQLQRELQQSVPCKRILGPNQYWLAFTECEYRSWDVISHFHHRQGTSFEEGMAAVRPEYLIIDGTVDMKLQEDFGTGGDLSSYYALPRADFQRFVDEKTTLVRWLTTPRQGTIQIREVHWEVEP